MPLRILISAGEVSGDMHAAALVKELKTMVKAPLELYGIGGDRLKEEGMELLAHVNQTGIMGVWEVLRRLRFFRALLRDTTRLLDTRTPDIVLTVDYVSFNLRLAKAAQKRGIPVIHYVCPQVWAWRRGRIPKIAKLLDHLMVLLPFEESIWKGTGLPVTFVGHPLVDRAAETRAEPPPALPWPGAEETAHKVALFPGSRPNEIRKHLRDILAAAVLTERTAGPCSFLIPTPTTEIANVVREELRRIPVQPSRLTVTEGHSRHALLQASAAVLKSGTGTLEASLMGCPSVIVYRLSWLSSLIARLLLRIKFVGLPNIVAGKEVFRELLQDAFTPEALSEELARLLTDATYRERMARDMDAVNAALGGTGASHRAAQTFLDHPALGTPSRGCLSAGG